MAIVKSTTPTIKIKQGITANYEKAIITLKNLKGDTIKKENPVNIDGIFEVDLSQTDTQTLGAGLVKFEIQYFYTDGTTNIEINGKIYMYDSFSDGKATATGGIDDEKIYTAELISDTLVNTTRGIVDIKKTATSGLVDTYTITYTDDTTSTFDVTNGEKGDTGEQGIQGEKGNTGATGEKGDSFTYDDFTAEQLANLKGDKGDAGEQGLKGDTGATGANGTNGQDGADGLTTSITTVDTERTQVDGNITIPVASENVFGLAKIWVSVEDEQNILNIVTEVTDE